MDAARSGPWSDGDPADPSDAALRFSKRAGERWDANGNPTPATLSLKRGEDGISVYLRLVLRHLGLPDSAALERRIEHGLFEIPVIRLVEAGCQVVHNPVEGTREADPAHGLILKPEVDRPGWLAIRERLLRESAVVLVEPPIHPQAESTQ